MSQSENISLWKKKSEIDYIPLFISLWLSLNAWIKDKFDAAKDRDLINLCKNGGHQLSDKFSDLMNNDNASGNRFRGNLAELQRALVNANIYYEKWSDKTINLENSIVSWNNGNPEFISLIKQSGQQDIIKIDQGLYVDASMDRLFSAYIEIVYQIRCSLFHGQLAPKQENERVIKQVYLTLSMVMERV